MNKRYLWLAVPLVLIVYAWSGPAISLAAISFVSSSSFGATASTNNVSTTLNVTANNLIVLGCRAGTTFVAPTNVTDTIGNTFTQFSLASNTSDGSLTGYYAISSGTNASDVIRCNFASSRNFRDITAATYTGVATTSPLDATSTSGTSTVSKSFPSGLFTTTNANDLAFTVGQNGGGNSMTAISTGYTIRSNLDIASIGVADADLVTSSIMTNASVTWTNAASTSWMIVVGTFKATTTPTTAVATTSDVTIYNGLTVRNGVTIR